MTELFDCDCDDRRCTELVRHSTAISVRCRTLRETHDLYRLWNWLGELLYIGQSISAAHRMSGHRREQPWWGEVTSITIEKVPSRRIDEAEKDAIQNEQPLYNKMYVKRMYKRQSVYSEETTFALQRWQAGDPLLRIARALKETPSYVAGRIGITSGQADALHIYFEEELAA